LPYPWKDNAPDDELTDALFAQLIGYDQQAGDAINEYTRRSMREDGLFRQLMPPVAISDDELLQEVSMSSPFKVVDRE
jgi:hypothetical protein